MRKFAFGRHAAGCVSALMGLVTLTFDLMTLKLVCESHLRWGTFILNLGTRSLWVLELFAMYATDGRTDGQTDRRTDKSNAKNSLTQFYDTQVCVLSLTRVCSVL